MKPAGNHIHIDVSWSTGVAWREPCFVGRWRGWAQRQIAARASNQCALASMRHPPGRRHCANRRLCGTAASGRVRQEKLAMAAYNVSSSDIKWQVMNIIAARAPLACRHH